MSAGDFLRDIYYKGEDKWYSFWDKVDSVIPVYKVIDPIDKAIPTFALFLVIIFILLLLAGTLLLGGFNTQKATLQITVVDLEGGSVSGAEVKIQGIEQSYTSNDFGLVEEVEVAYNATLSVSAEKEDKKTTVPVTIDEYSKIFTITLPISGANYTPKSIRFKIADGSLATGEINIHYACSQSQTNLPPDETIYGGTANVAQSSGCGTLSLTINSPKYETATFSLTGPSGVFELTPKGEAETATATINLKYEGQLITEIVNVQAYSTNNTYLPVDTKQTANGQAIFTLPEGEYKFKVQQQKGYKQKESAPVMLTKAQGNKTIDILLEKNILGIIIIQTKEGSQNLEGVHITLSKISQNTMSEVIAYDTNEDGTVMFELAEDENYIASATKDEYCDQSASVEIGDNKIFNMKRYDGTCGNRLKARVIDQDNKPVAYARTAIFLESAEDTYKLPYQEKITDYNGYVTWNPVQNTKANEKYKIFAFKHTYSGWSESRTFNATTSLTEYVIKLEIPMGMVRVNAKNTDGEPLQFAQVQLYDEYSAEPVSGKKIIENADGTIEIPVKADKKIYAVIKKEKYQSYTSLPVQVLPSGNTIINATLMRPPAEQLQVKPLGLFKNGETVLKVEAGQEYDALFEITAPKDYDELGFFVRTGKEDMTKTELDKIFIKNGSEGGVNAGGKKIIITGSTYNPPKGYNIDSQYTNLEESKWAQITWTKGGYEQGKIIASVKVKIRQTAQQEERLEIWSRAWGIKEGKYERDLFDSELGTSQNSSTKQEIYALSKPMYISVGIETLCDSPTGDTSFCISATYTDPENFTKSFTDTFDAKNNSTYAVSIRIVNNSPIGFDNAKLMIQNPEENILFGEYAIVTPRYVPITGTLNKYTTEWIGIDGFVPNSPVDISTIKITPQKTGTGTLRIRIRDDKTLIYEKDFTVNIASDKKMAIQYMAGGIFKTEMPSMVSGKLQNLTIKALNAANALEIQNAKVKLYDRFHTLLLTQTTNKLGVATIQIPASFPGEKLVISVEAPEYETYTQEFKIAEDIVTVEPETLAFTVNPQTTKEAEKKVKITNKTGFDLIIKEIKLTGKLKGLLNESAIESWFLGMKGKKISSQDFEEIVFKVISAPTIPIADDIEAKFEITLGAEGKEWVKDIETKIRVGMGKDVDIATCLEVTRTNWEAITRGQTVETSLEIRNNCLVDGKPVPLKNLGAIINSTSSVTGTYNAQSRTVQVELASAYPRIFAKTINAGEKIPVTIKFTPMAGTQGSAEGTIVFEAQNLTDSKAQKLTAEMKYKINYENLQDCIVLGTDQLTIQEEETGAFTITNNCKSKADVLIIPEDMQASIATTNFSLNPSEKKDITVISQKGQIPGAYNVIVSARTQGTTLEAITNIKVIIEPKNSCFKLTRYIYDVYASPSDTTGFAGIDRGYLTNECIESRVNVKVTGNVPADTSAILKSMLWGALVGGATSYFKTGKLLPDKVKKWFTGDKVSSNIEEAYTNASQKVREQAGWLDGRMQERMGTITVQKDLKKQQLQTRTAGLETQLNANKENANKACDTKVDEAQKSSCKESVATQGKENLAKIESAKTKADEEIDKKAKELDAIKESAKKELVTRVDFAQKAILEEKKTLQEGAKNGTVDSEAVLTKVIARDKTNTEEINKPITKMNEEWKPKAAEFNELIKKSVENYGLTEDLTKITVDGVVPATAATTTAQTYMTDLKKAENKTMLEEKLKSLEIIEENINARYAEVDEKVEMAFNIIKETKEKINSTLTKLKSEVASAVIVADLKEIEDKEQRLVFILSEVLPAVPIAPVVTDGSASFSFESSTSVKAEPISTTTGGISINETEFKTKATSLLASNDVDSYPNNCSIEKQENSFVVKWADERAFSPIKFYTDNWKYDSAKKYWSIVRREYYDRGYKDLKQIVFIKYANEGLSGLYDELKSVSSANFLLATNTGPTGGEVLSNVLTTTAGPLVAGLNMPNALGGVVTGALLNGFLSWMQAKDTPVDLTDSFSVPLVVYRGAELQSKEGIQMNVGEPTYEFQSTGGLNFGKTQATTNTANSTVSNSGILYNPQALSASVGVEEQREIEFINPSTEIVQKDKRSPFVGVLTVTGDQNVYEEKYNYEKIKEAAEKRGEYESKTGSFLKDFFAPPTSNKALAQMTEADLKVKEVRVYEKKFHLLFEAWEYVSCGPNTFPCDETKISNCDVDGKKGLTGPEGVPRISLKWGWNETGIQECDSDNNPEYVYCDITQLTTSTLKKLIEAQDFFKTNTLANCPTINDIASKTQKISQNNPDVGITSIQIKSTEKGAILEAIAETNNNLPMNATMKYRLTRQNGEEVKENGSPICPDLTQNFTSTSKFECALDSSKAGVGTFNLEITLIPEECSECNYDTTNDAIQTGFVLGQTGAAQCQAYKTNKDYFEKVLIANNLINTEKGKKMMEYISFKANLVRDGFTEDFKNDYDTYMNQIAGAPEIYREGGIRDLFLSDKFSVNWPQKGSGPWEAGKYDAQLVITFKNESWHWDNNNIESIALNLSPQGEPEPDFTIYSVAFNGPVGLTSENGRQGYGAGYTQLTEGLFKITTDMHSDVTARPNSSSNAVTQVNVSQITGTKGFDLLNSTPTKGNVLSIYRTGDIVDFTITPSAAVPLILNITRNTGVDAYAFYSAEVNGQPQETGTSFISWTGIGQGCITFDGSPMQAYSKTPDYKANSQLNGMEGYGLYWPMVKTAGTASFYGEFYAPQDAATVLKMIGAKDSAEFESTHGNGTTIAVSSNSGIKTLSDVLDLVKAEKVCVLGGDYYWNNTAIREEMIDAINAKENTCIPAVQ